MGAARAIRARIDPEVSLKAVRAFLQIGTVLALVADPDGSGIYEGRREKTPAHGPAMILWAHDQP